MTCCACGDDWHGDTGCWNCPCTRAIVRDPDAEAQLEEQIVAKCEADVAALERKHRASRQAESEGSLGVNNL